MMQGVCVCVCVRIAVQVQQNLPKRATTFMIRLDHKVNSVPECVSCGRESTPTRDRDERECVMTTGTHLGWASRWAIPSEHAMAGLSVETLETLWEPSTGVTLAWQSARVLEIPLARAWERVSGIASESVSGCVWVASSVPRSLLSDTHCCSQCSSACTCQNHYIMESNTRISAGLVIDH